VRGEIVGVAVTVCELRGDRGGPDIEHREIGRGFVIFSSMPLRIGLSTRFAMRGLVHLLRLVLARDRVADGSFDTIRALNDVSNAGVVRLARKSIDS
jgi:hypothetical protein